MLEPEKSFYVTTPIYYVNDLPHIGHAYTTIAADIIARFKRLDGCRVKFLTGTDEHGQKVEKAAHNKGLLPKDFVDLISCTFRDLAIKLQSSHDDFIRTTEPRHALAVKALWQRLVDRGQIHLGTYSGWYAIRDEAFYAEDELIEGKAPTGADVEWVTEPSYFFPLSQWQEPLLRFYEENPTFIMPESRRNEVVRFVEGGLIDLSISRTSLTWGIPVPGDSDHVIYVWLDALSNYITAVGYPDNVDEDLWNSAVHIVGKDILRFHAVYWPAFLMAAGLKPPAQVFAHGWWTHEGQKISKSLGNTIDPVALIDKYGIDPVRYFLFREISFGQDGNFSHEALVGRLNSDLANNYGNLVQRVLSIAQKNLGGIVPQPQAFMRQDERLLQQADGLLVQVRQDMDALLFHRACEHIWRMIAEANRYVDEEKPWVLKGTDPERLKTVIYVLLEAIRKVALLTQPIMPEGSGKILDQLAIPLDKRDFAHWSVPVQPGTALLVPQGVFPRWVQATVE
jgi:methionyl-tRNA synthetase